MNKEDLLKIKESLKNKTVEELHQKIVNLHSELFKTRIKNKNQTEELNKLNIKLQKCISLEEHDFKIKTVLNEKHKLEVENKEMGRLINLNASALVLVGQTKDLAMQKIEEQSKEIEKLKAVIEYLESKLK